MRRLLTILFIMCGMLPGCAKKQSGRVNHHNQIIEQVDVIELAKRTPMEDIDHGSFTVSNSYAHKTSKKNNTFQKNAVNQQQQARHADIPLPFNAQRVAYDDAISNPEQMVVSYCSQDSLDDTVAFYVAEMERNGWQELGSVLGSQAQLTFVKPERICSVTINPSVIKDQLLDISVFAGLKNGLSNS